MEDKDKKEKSDAVAIEKERQKTKRYFMFLSFFTIIALTGIFIVFKGSESGGKRSVDLDITKGKLSFSVEKPLVQQVNQPTSNYSTSEGTVKFTTGKIDPTVIQRLDEEGVSIEPTRFTGQNFINKQAGFLLTVNNPDYWEVLYDPSGLVNPTTPINTIVTDDGSHLNINLENLMPGTNLETYVTQGLQTLIFSGLLSQMPEVSYDHASQTAFLSYFNPMTNGETYQKVIVQGSKAYIASANYNTLLSNRQRIRELIEMIASFTLIGS